MKKLLFVSLAIALSCFTDLKAHNYTEGDALTVVANSGLRVRMSPGQSAKTIHILHFGDRVNVDNTFGFSDEYADRVGWMDGHWIKVRVANLTGYVFDGFLSGLSVPTHENQLCIDCSSMTHAIDRYLTDNYPTICAEEGMANSEEVSQFVSQLESGITVTRTTGDGWYQLEVAFGENRICEVLNALRSMMVGTRAKQNFESSLVFHEGIGDMITKVEVTLFGNPITIERDGEVVHLRTTMFSEETSGC